MKTTVSSKGQIVIPADIRTQDRIRSGQQFQIHRLEEGEYLLKRQPAGNNEGLMVWLLGCPEKDWFHPIESESTDAL